jgi:hypothetical protein
VEAWETLVFCIVCTQHSCRWWSFVGGENARQAGAVQRLVCDSSLLLAAVPACPSTHAPSARVCAPSRAGDVDGATRSAVFMGRLVGLASAACRRDVDGGAAGGGGSTNIPTMLAHCMEASLNVRLWVDNIGHRMPARARA